MVLAEGKYCDASSTTCGVYRVCFSWRDSSFSPGPSLLPPRTTQDPHNDDGDDRLFNSKKVKRRQVNRQIPYFYKEESVEFTLLHQIKQVVVCKLGSFTTTSLFQLPPTRVLLTSRPSRRHIAVPCNLLLFLFVSSPSTPHSLLLLLLFPLLIGSFSEATRVSISNLTLLWVSLKGLRMCVVGLDAPFLILSAVLPPFVNVRSHPLTCLFSCRIEIDSSAFCFPFPPLCIILNDDDDVVRVAQRGHKLSLRGFIMILRFRFHIVNAFLYYSVLYVLWLRLLRM